MRGQKLHFPLEQGSKTKENHSEITVPDPGSCGSQLLLAPPGLGRLSHIPPQICSFLLLLLLGHWVYKNPENPKEKAAASFLNRVQGWMCPASQPARLGKTRTAAYTTGRQLADPSGPADLQPARAPEGRSGVQATLPHQLSDPFCLPNSSAVSEPDPIESEDPVRRYAARRRRTDPRPASTRGHTQQEFAE